MDYNKIYNSLIQRSKTRSKSDGYYESHHIIPRCMNGSDEQDNLVLLTPEEHYLAHQLLIRIYPDNLNLVFAANMLCTNRMNNKLYGWIRRKLSHNMKINNPNKDGNVNRKRKGKYNLSEQAKQKISKGCKGKINIGENNAMFKIKPWNHPRATEKTKNMWAKADQYYLWWIDNGVDKGQNPMAKHFDEVVCMTHTNLVKYFRLGWIPEEDEEWKQFSCKI